MKNPLFAIVSTMAVLAGCAKESIAPSSPEKETTTQLTVTLGGSAKTHLDPSESGTRKVYWSENDQINVNGTTSRALTGVGEKQSSGTFIFDAVLSAPYKVTYPASFYTSDGKITLPSVQSYAEGTFATNTAPLAGYLASGSGLTMKNVSAALKLNIKGSEEKTISYVEFLTNGTEQVSGLFSVNYETGKLTSVSTVAGDRTVRVNVDKTVSTTTSIDVYVMIPAGTYASGYTVRIVDSEGYFMEASKSESKTFNAGEVVSTNTITYTATGTIIEISTPAEWNSFISSFNSGTYVGKTLQVNLANDITFDTTTSSAFRALGSSTYAFNGVFDGRGHTVKSLSTLYGLFYVPNGATIKNMTFDSSCNLYHNSTTSGSWGGVVRGAKTCNISDITVKCDVTVYYSTASSAVYIGGIVGSADKTTVIENCNMEGDIVYANSGQVANGNQNIGGIVGYLTDNASVVRNCTMSGDLNFPELTTTITSKASGIYNNYGGIAGGGNGIIENCTMSGNLTFADRVCDLIAGGISGWFNGTMSNCTFSGTLAVNTPYSYSTSTPYTRGFVGGLVGRLAGTVDNCETLSGSNLTIIDGRRYSSFGGLVGKTFSPAVISNCVNRCAVSQSTSASLQIDIAGIVGYFYQGTLTNVVNEGTVTVNHPNETSTSTTRVGGIVGVCDTAIDGVCVTSNVSQIHNKGQILSTLEESSVGFGSFDIGGVVGRSGADLSNLTNAGIVQVDVRTGDGTLNFKNISEGGIIGRFNGSSTLKGCVNTVATRYYGGKGACTSRFCHVGGIAGLVAADVTSSGVTGVAATVESCHNYGNLGFSNYNTAYPNGTHTQGNYVGGLIGSIVGKGTYDRAVVKDCDHIASSVDTHYRGYFSGFIGTTYCADVTNCVNKTSIKCESPCAERVSGLIGFAQGYCTVSYCQVRANITNGACLAGIASAANSSGLEFLNCIFIGNFTTTRATSCSGVIHNSLAGVKVTSCGVKGTYKTANESAAVTFTDIPATYDVGLKATQSGNYIIDDENYTGGTSESYSTTEYYPD